MEITFGARAGDRIYAPRNTAHVGVSLPLSDLSLSHYS